MSEAKTTPGIAKYKLQIKSNTGYSSTTTGECTPEQYSAACAALAGKNSESDLLDALNMLADYVEERNGDNECRPLENARAAIAKATTTTP